jgi:predicted nucleic acid-binding protein
MPTSDNRPQLLIDTSVAVALAVAGHEHHQAIRKAVGDRSCGLSGHAAFETFSVLTRLPPPNRRSGTGARTQLPRIAVPQRPGRATAPCQAGIAGGAVYDALVAATAAEQGITLATRDRRAAETYRALDVDFELID